MERQILQRVVIPPLIIAVCWFIFTYGGIVHFISPIWDQLSVFCFAALVVGLPIVPCKTIFYFVSWLRASSQDQDKAYLYSSFVGWGLALIVLIGGFAIVPWSMG